MKSTFESYSCLLCILRVEYGAYKHSTLEQLYTAPGAADLPHADLSAPCRTNFTGALFVVSLRVREYYISLPVALHIEQVSISTSLSATAISYIFVSRTRVFNATRASSWR